MFGEVIASGFLRTPERHPVVRTGPRDEIPWHIRSGVWYRDRGKCQLCGTHRPKPWHLDHIKPWSAGGSDHTSNLRLLCEPCNVARSNHIDGEPVPRQAVTWWCHRCYMPEHGWSYVGDSADPFMNGLAEAAGGTYCYRRHRCRVEALYAMQRDRGDEPTWHKRRPIEHLTTTAFCAHCNTPGLTDVTL